MMVSVIIPTRNAGDHLQKLLMALKGQSVPCEIIVIDSSSTDATISIARSYGAKTIIIRREDFDHGGTRNAAVSHASGDILVFLTQDALPVNQDLIQHLIRPLEDARIALCYGRQIARSDSTPLERFARAFNYPAQPIVKGSEHCISLGIKTFFCSNVCSAIRRSAFEEVEGFPEKVIMNEDMILSAKLILKGHKTAYVPEAEVFHSHTYTWKQQFKRYFDIGVSLKDNAWILQHVGADKAGAEFLRKEMRYLSNKKEYQWILYAIGEAIVKYSGYKFGLHYYILPDHIRKKFSMHGNYWNEKAHKQRL